jgi:hypothetical protein
VFKVNGVDVGDRDLALTLIDAEVARLRDLQRHESASPAHVLELDDLIDRQLDLRHGIATDWKK